MQTKNQPRIVETRARDGTRFKFILPSLDASTIQCKPGVIYLNPASPREGLVKIMEKGKINFREFREGGFSNQQIEGWLHGAKLSAPYFQSLIKFAKGQGLDVQAAYPDLWNGVKKLRFELGLDLETFASNMGLGMKKDADNLERSANPIAKCPPLLIELANKHGIEIRDRLRVISAP